jgi:hypothetical protein
MANCVELLLALLAAAGPPAAGLAVGGSSTTMHWDASQLDYQRGGWCCASRSAGRHDPSGRPRRSFGLEFDDSKWAFSGNVRLHARAISGRQRHGGFVDSRVDAASVHGSRGVRWRGRRGPRRRATTRRTSFTTSPAVRCA